MNIACLQLNPTVGWIPGNIKTARNAIAACPGADVIVLPELYITGYPPRDLLLWSNFIDANLAAKNELVKLTADIPAALVFGYVEQCKSDGCKPLYNAVCVAQGGKVVQQRYKTLLPTYDVFAERRYFTPGHEKDIVPAVVEVRGSPAPIGVVICEEAWNDAEFWKTHDYPFDPVALMCQRGAKHIISINASPYRHYYRGDFSVSQIRRSMVGSHPRKHGVPFTWVGQTGGNDDCVFDGNSFGMDAHGEVVAHAHHCAEDTMWVTTESNGHLPGGAYTNPVEEDILRVLRYGVSDYYAKQPFLKEAWLGLSGGIDSALVNYITAQAIGPKRLITFGMPSEFSSIHSVSDAERLALKTGTDYYMAPIREPHDAFRHVFDDVLGQMSRKRGINLNGRPILGLTAESGVTDQNIQARTRDVLLMIGANKFDGLLMLTGNKSESAVGYYTLYDMCGGLGVIADLYKTLVKRLCIYINNTSREEIIPWNTINKPPSAELAANQVDTDSLPPYGWLDQILVRFVEDHQATERIVAEFATTENQGKYASETALAGKRRNLVDDIRWTTKAVIRNQWKRDQSARGIKVTPQHFKYGWELPIVHRAEL